MASSEGHLSRLPLPSCKVTKAAASLPTPAATSPPSRPTTRPSVFERLSKPTAPRTKQNLQAPTPAPFRPFLARPRPQNKDLRTAAKPTKPGIKTRSTPLQHIPQYAHDAGAWTPSTTSTNAPRSPGKAPHAASREACFLQSENEPLDAEAAVLCSTAHPPQDQYRRKARDILSSMRADLRSDVSSWRSSRDRDDPIQACSKLDELSLTTKSLVAKGRKALATIASGCGSVQDGCTKISDQDDDTDADDETLVDHEHNRLSIELRSLMEDNADPHDDEYEDADDNYEDDSYEKEIAARWGKKTAKNQSKIAAEDSDSESFMQSGKAMTETRESSCLADVPSRTRAPGPEADGGEVDVSWLTDKQREAIKQASEAAVAKTKLGSPASRTSSRMAEFVSFESKKRLPTRSSPKLSTEGSDPFGKVGCHDKPARNKILAWTRMSPRQGTPDVGTRTFDAFDEDEWIPRPRRNDSSISPKRTPTHTSSMYGSGTINDFETDLAEKQTRDNSLIIVTKAPAQASPKLPIGAFDEFEDGWADDELASSDFLDPAPPEVPYEQKEDVLGLVDEYINDVCAMWQRAVPDKEEEAEANVPASFDFSENNEEQRLTDVEQDPIDGAQSVETWGTPQETTDALLSRWSEPPEDIERYSPEGMQTRSILEFNDDLVPYVHKDGYGIEDECFDDRAHAQSDRIQIVRIKVESPTGGPAPLYVQDEPDVMPSGDDTVKAHESQDRAKEVDASDLSHPRLGDAAKTGEEDKVIAVGAATDGVEHIQRSGQTSE